MINTDTVKPKGSLLVVFAPSGTGKTSLVKALVASDDQLQVSVSHTTREKRPGEVHGRDYFFVDENTFTAMRQEQAFLESATVYGHNYGTSKHEVAAALYQGMDVILEIDWQGARQIAEKMPDAVTIGVIPPSIETLQQRLTARGKDSQQVIAQRMAKACDEVQRQIEQQVDYIVVNDVFESTLEKLQHLVAASRLRGCINRYLYSDLLGARKSRGQK